MKYLVITVRESQVYDDFELAYEHAKIEKGIIYKCLECHSFEPMDKFKPICCKKCGSKNLSEENDLIYCHNCGYFNDFDEGTYVR